MAERRGIEGRDLAFAAERERAGTGVSEVRSTLEGVRKRARGASEVRRAREGVRERARKASDFRRAPGPLTATPAHA